MIQVQGGPLSGPKMLMNKLVQQAKAGGADGLVNIQYQIIECGRVFSGKAVKFEEELNR